MAKNAASAGGTTKRQLKFNLVENGIDFIRSGIEQYFLRDTPKARDHKYAVLHIFAGVLLLLKERLRRAHPSLIFTRVEDAVKDVTKEDIKTVAFDQAVDRLKACAAVTIADEHLRALRSAQRVRNQLEHYEVTLNLKQTQDIVGSLCEFVYVFMRDQLGEDLANHLKGPVWSRVQELRGIARELEEERAAEWRERAKRFQNLPPWRLAKMRDSIEPYHPKHNPDPETIHTCPACGSESVIITDEGDVAVCTNPKCRDVAEAGSCTRCGLPVVGGATFCDDCQGYFDYQMGKD